MSCFLFYFFPLSFVLLSNLFYLTHCSIKKKKKVNSLLLFFFSLEKYKSMWYKNKVIGNWRTLRSCVGGIELLVLVQNIWTMQLKLWLRKEKSDEFSYCTTTCQHLLSISYAIELCQRKKSRKDPLWNSFLVWDFECC